jgi:hypothetical protein
VINCSIRITTFEDDNSVWRKPKFGETQRHFMTEPLKVAEDMLNELERLI